MTITYKNLLESRANFNAVKGTTYNRDEWKPYELKKLPVKQPEAMVFMQKAVALGLVLEMEVAEFIGDCLRKSDDLPHTAKELLKSNIRDESVHNKAFKELSKVIEVPDHIQEKANNIADIWMGCTEESIQKARCLEAGVFLTTLATLARTGSQSSYGVALAISKDEFRHVGTGYLVLKDKGIPLYSNELLSMIKDTLDWLFENVTVKIGDKIYTTDGFITMGLDMLKYGESKELQSFSSHGFDISPFEIQNQVLEQIAY